MKKRFIFLFITLISVLMVSEAAGKSRIVKSSGKFDTRFLIVVDKQSYYAATNEINGYKKVLEGEGLGVIMLIGEWSDPMQLRSEIVDIYKKRPPLEGAVFVGDIPVARVRNFQHATTAFKMDEENFPMTDASVTSDRFYDDLDLEFELIKQDPENPRHFYYKLKESSPQTIASEFYSARVLPPSDYGVDTYELLRRFFKKAIQAHSEKNYADNIIFFNGHGYNSDCMTVWQNQQFAIKEQFPEAFKSSKGNAFYNFRQDPYMKFKLFEKMQRAGTDLFVFHEHGAFDTQYINGDFPAPNMLGYNPAKEGSSVAPPQGTWYSGVKPPVGPMEAMGVSLRNTYRRYKGERAEQYRKDMISELGLSEDFFSASNMKISRFEDSTLQANINISLTDLRNVKPQSRVSIFDACYNGSFHQKGYVAGYHIFADGNTVVTQGNTVNVLQDKWSMELIGMLAEGSRIGFWQKEIQTLESHLIGDPTYRFTPGSPSADRASDGVRLNRDLALKSKDSRYWMQILEGNTTGNNISDKDLVNYPGELFNSPNYKAIALKQLSKNPPPGYSSLLLKYVKESPHYIVRMQALKRLIDLSDNNLVDALLVSLEDPYELTRRNAARFAGYSGDNRLISPLIHTILFSNESQRVQYAAQNSLLMFDKNLVLEEIAKQAKGSNLLNPEKTVSDLTKYYNGEFKRQDVSLATIMDKKSAPEKRISAIRSLRNYNNHKQVTQLLEVLQDSSDDLKVRVTLAEALGWFNWSIRKADILKALAALLADKSLPKELRDEVQQSFNRL
ncbi:MAG: HEAT repeat domain-containing protein [Bacteroidales bacterium]